MPLNTYLVVTELRRRTAYYVDAESPEAAEAALEEHGSDEFDSAWSRTSDHQVVGITLVPNTTTEA